MAQQGGPSGIILGITWPEVGKWVVIERDTGSGFPSPVQIATLTVQVSEYTDSLPQDGITYYYRAKHVAPRGGEGDSAWSSTVSGTPQDIGIE